MEILPPQKPGVNRVPEKVDGDPCGPPPKHVDKVCKVNIECYKLRQLFRHCCNCKGMEKCLDRQIAAQRAKNK
jgi:hypothetical protein